MFSRKKVNKISDDINTLIGPDAVIQGDVGFNGGLRVDGTIRGNVTEQQGSPSTIVISETGRIEGSRQHHAWCCGGVWAVPSPRR